MFLVKHKHREYLAKIETSLHSNPKLFWSYHKAILHHKSSSSPVLTYGGVTVNTPAKKAELFNSYFSSVFSVPRSIVDTTSDNVFSPKTDLQLSDIKLSVEEVAKCLSTLDTSKAGGPDGIPTRLLKDCGHQIAPSICNMFNLSLLLGKLPSEWKLADATPIHKKDSKELAENYRPISLPPILGKVLERCVCIRLYDHVINLITPLQHGFLRKRSCATQLLQVLHSIGRYLDKNTQTDILYLDFAKAFDSVDHGILLDKLKSFGISGHLFNWFADYLTGRKQRVVVDGVASDWAPVTSGVPQGSLLGPVLFILFINDLPEAVSNGIIAALYADDTKLYKNITSVDDSENLQQTPIQLGNLEPR